MKFTEKTLRKILPDIEVLHLETCNPKSNLKPET
jgi:hypothetical protein